MRAEMVAGRKGKETKGRDYESGGPRQRFARRESDFFFDIIFKSPQ